MRRLTIPFLKNNTYKADEINLLMDSLEAAPIDRNPWPSYLANTEAKFIMAHNGESILLKYIIAEEYLMANEITNGNIHNDSCVEFFISFDDFGYYNLEFNCLGFTKIGYGSDRNDRKLLPIEVVEKLSFSSKINANGMVNGTNGFEWEITLIIPKEIFVEHKIASFHQLRAKGNFYKCGDGLPQPHFLTWNMIVSEEPDFHLKEFFGELAFG